MMGGNILVSTLMLFFVLCTCTKDKVSSSTSKTPQKEGQFESLNYPEISISEAKVDFIKSRIPVLARKEDEKYSADAQIKYHTEVIGRCRRAIEYFGELKNRINQALPKFETIRRAIIDIRINNAESHPFFQEYGNKSRQILNAINGEIRYLRKSIRIKRELIRYINNRLYGYSIKSIKKLSRMAKKAIGDLKNYAKIFDGLEHIERGNVYILGEKWVKLSFKWINDLKEIIGDKYKVVERYGSIGGFMQVIDAYLNEIRNVAKMTQALVDEPEITPNVQEVITVYDDLDMISPSESDSFEIDGVDFDCSSESSVTGASECGYKVGMRVSPVMGAHSVSPRPRSLPPHHTMSSLDRGASSQEDELSTLHKAPLSRIRLVQPFETYEMISGAGASAPEYGKEFSVIRRWNGDAEVRLYQKMEDPDFAHIEENDVGKFFKHFVVTQEMLDCNIVSLSGRATPISSVASLKNSHDGSVGQSPLHMHLDPSLLAMHVENEKLKVLINKSKMPKIEMYVQELESKKRLLLSFMSTFPGITQTLGKEYIEDLQESLGNKFQGILDACANLNGLFGTCMSRFESLKFYLSKGDYNLVKSLMVVQVVNIPPSNLPIYLDNIGTTSRIQMNDLYEKVADYQKKVSMMFMLFDATVLFTRISLERGHSFETGSFCKFAKKVLESSSIRNPMTELLDSFVEHYKTLENDTTLLYAAANLFDRNVLKSVEETCTPDLVDAITNFLNSPSFKEAYRLDVMDGPTIGKMDGHYSNNAQKEVRRSREEIGRPVEQRTINPDCEIKLEVARQSKILVRDSKCPSGEYKRHGAIPKRK